MVISRAKKKNVDVGANDDLPSEVVNKPGKHEYRSCFVDMVQVGEFVHHGDISDTEGGGLAQDVQNSETSVQEITEDEHEEEVKQPICQSQSSVHSSRGHTPFDFVLGGAIRIFLDVMMGLKGMRLTTLNLSATFKTW